MRRKWAAAVLAAGLFAVGACGDDGNGGEDPEEPTGKSNEEICTDLEAAGTDMETELNTAMTDATTAMQEGDQAAALEAFQDLQTAIDDFTEAMRTNADEAEDPETADTLNGAADELDTFVDEIDIAAIQETGEVPDMTALETAGAEVDALCGTA